MRSERKKIIKRNNKRKRKLFFTVFIISILFCSVFIYGENVFYAIKTFVYRNQALKIDIQSEKNDDLENINLNFKNEGSCDVYLRGFVFVYPKNNLDNGTILSNSSVKVNYGDENLWYMGEDDYVYYTQPLKGGNSTEKPMVESIEINLSEEDKRMLGEEELSAEVVMEAVQVNNFAYKYQWDMRDVELEELFNKEKECEVLESNEVIELIFE